MWPQRVEELRVAGTVGGGGGGGGGQITLYTKCNLYKEKEHLGMGVSLVEKLYSSWEFCTMD